MNEPINTTFIPSDIPRSDIPGVSAPSIFEVIPVKEPIDITFVPSEIPRTDIPNRPVTAPPDIPIPGLPDETSEPIREILGGGFRDKSKRKVSKTRSFNVYVRDIKKTKKKGKEKGFSKINTKRLGLDDAKDLREFILDTSLARTGELRPAKGKPSKPTIRVPKGYSDQVGFKFRRFEQKKGKRKALSPRRVIERSVHIGDTLGEVQGLSARSRAKQLTLKKPSTKKVNNGRKKDLSTDISLLN